MYTVASVVLPKGDGSEQEVRWFYLRRTDYASRRGTKKGGIAQFYPIYVDDNTKKIIRIGNPLEPDVDRNSVEKIDGATAVFPVRDDGVEMNWGVTGESLQNLLNEGLVRITDAVHVHYEQRKAAVEYQNQVDQYYDDLKNLPRDEFMKKYWDFDYDEYIKNKHK